MDPKSFIQNAQKMQETLKKMSQDMEEKSKTRTVTVKAGGNLVEICMNLKKQVKRLDLKPALFEETPEVISELITAAFNQAVYEADSATKEEMAQMTRQLNIPPGFPSSLGG